MALAQAAASLPTRGAKAVEGLRVSLGAGKEGGKQENRVALTRWRWCPELGEWRVLQGTCRSLGGEGGGDADPAVMLPLCIPEPSLQAAVGLQHNSTRREKGGVGEHCVHVQVGFQLWTSPPRSLAAPTSPGGSQSLRDFSCVKAIGFQAMGLFSVALSAFTPAYIIAITLPVCPSFAPAFTASCFHLCVELGWCHR